MDTYGHANSPKVLLSEITVFDAFATKSCKNVLISFAMPARLSVMCPLQQIENW